MSSTRRLWTSIASSLLLSGLVSTSTSDPAAARAPDEPAVVHADVVALDQIIVYNRFGSFDPYGMIFALRRDVSESAGLGDASAADACATKTGAETGTGELMAGKVRLKDCKRPRPLVLRARVGDVLRINLKNLLRPNQPGVSETFCRTGVSGGRLPNIGDIRGSVSHDGDLRDGAPLCDAAGVVGAGVDQSGVDQPGKEADWPRTRALSFTIPGLEPIPNPGEDTVPDACKGLASVAPGRDMTCHFRLDREGTHLFQSMAAAAGGEGDGGSFTHGLFGALVIEPAGSQFYRSQVPMQAFDTVWERKPGGPVHARLSTPSFDASVSVPTPVAQRSAGNPCASSDAVPVASMLRDCAKVETVTLRGMRKDMPVVELVHSDINAIIVPPAAASGTAAGDSYEDDKPSAQPFREFVVIFHDEMKAYYTKEFENLANFEQFSGVGEGFGINYGASGAGSLILANRKKIGPAADCPECMYEEFFLASWANGDPALLENFVDDPSNVHHSYLNDRVVFRNFHAGPKETHVFHLHSHQWFAGNDKNRGAYLDSQTIGPQQGMSYDIYGGGTEIYRPAALADGKGFYETLGSGNRNRTPGDAIFHCHLYPHFAQGMWELWRVHDVLEDGTRTLPDGQKTPGLSVDVREAGERALARTGTLTAGDGPSLWQGDLAGYSAEGTPIPGLLPIPRQAAPLLPTYDAERGFPGYPFYIAGVPGHRTPQAPMDIAVEGSERLDGGLGRHVVVGGSRLSDVAAGPKSGWAAAGIEDRDGIPYHDGKIVPVSVAQKLALGDLTETFDRLEIRLLPPDGTRLERRAMAFHHEGLIEGDRTDPARRLLLRRSDGTEITALPGLAARPLPDIPQEPAAGAPQSEVDAFENAVAQTRQALGYGSTLIPDAPPAAGEPLVAAAFGVNGAPPKPGAPFADPCGAPDALRGSALRNPRGDGDDDLNPAQTGRPLAARNSLVGGPDKFGGLLDAAYPPQDMTYDSGLSGFRRFKASVVQFDMVVNKAGWHDPQARINVLTRLSDLYKPGGERAVSGREEPFYFRAFSGDCIEFRHTNETPHKLGLDDFQAKVPTDTIGQHIHLVKFDVTSSDGSGNGWNYEDGTFAPDELKERIHAANRQEAAQAGSGWQAHADNNWFSTTQPTNHVDLVAYRDSVAEGSPWAETCGREKEVWALPRTQNRQCFQTTVQRWFADPILSRTGEAGQDRYADRTLRTVFTHDHFAPSNIQQHGFYNALLIEPVSKDATVYSADRTQSQPMLRASFAPWTDVGGNVLEPVLVDAFEAPAGAAVASADGDTVVNLYAAIVAGDPDCDVRNSLYEPAEMLARCNYSDNGVGARALLEQRRGLYEEAPPDPTKTISDPLHPNYREFALAIADFALLYDGKAAAGAKPDSVTDLDGEGEAAGIDRLIGEALLDYPKKVADLYRGKAARAKARDICEHNRGRPATTPDAERSVAGLDVLPPAQAVACEIHEERTAAGWLPAAASQLKDGYFDPIRAEHGKPVYPPKRPEAISQTHHDPYLVNYRNDPIPLRVGETAQGKDVLAGRRCPDFTGRRDDAVADANSVSRQKGDSSLSGDMARAFRSAEHGDPCTPVLESYDGERVMVRLIQGAQEVQHVFTVEGRPFRRNVDQTFGFGARLDAERSKGKGPTRWNDCMRAAERGSPTQYQKWFGSGSEEDASRTWLMRYRTLTAECDNVAGYVTAQEIGISEHFEFAGAFSSSSGALAESATILADPLGASTVKPGALPMRDSLFHFGTVDALWNGGWGLIRTFGGPDAPDTTQCLTAAEGDDSAKRAEKCLVPTTEAPEVSLRLQRLVDDEGALAEAAFVGPEADRKVAGTFTLDETAASLPTYPDLSCPFIDPSAVPDGGNAGAASRTRHVFAAVAALETRHLNSGGVLGGTVYDAKAGLYDPDGLVFVALDPKSLGLTRAGGSASDAATAILQQERRGALDEAGRFGNVTWKTLLGAAKAQLKADGGGLRPYVQRFNAGDCIHLVVVNGLTTTRLPGQVFGDMVGNNRGGLRDRPGDAFLPRITRLNNDQIKDGASDAQDERVGEVSPSASLAVSLPLSQVTNVNDAPEPVGANPRLALPPAAMGAAAPYTILTFYAGTVKAKAAELDDALVNVDLQRDAAKLDPNGAEQPIDMASDKPLCSFESGEGTPATYAYLVWPSARLACGSNDNMQIESNVLGRRYCATVGKLTTGTALPQYSVRQARDAGVRPDHARLQSCLRQMVQTTATAPSSELRLRVVPHAFGTLPFKSISDPIGHGPHGLAGTVVIEPMSAAHLRRAGAQDTSTTWTSPPGEDLDGSVRPAGGATAELEAVPSWTLIDRGQASRDAHAIIRVDEIAVPSVGDVADYPADTLGKAMIYESALLWQDGLNLWDARRRPFYAAGCALGARSCSDANDPSMRRRIGGPVPDCAICDDSYDRGEKGVSYGTNALFGRLRGTASVFQPDPQAASADHRTGSSRIPATIGPQDWRSAREARIYDGRMPAVAEGTSDLNAWSLPSDLFSKSRAAMATPLIEAPAGAQMMVRIVEPQGRARQRAFVPTGASYQDIFPGFGAGHATLLAPGKGITAVMEAPDAPGDYLWFDGPRQLLDGGTWGLMSIAPALADGATPEN